mmetsp:Transcript_29989/g.59563  ORF Transcript_29989/g.59563 Transcript_29989/m.59563 type:complete len:784 (+) Transcript_29989:846-3197(+)
MGGLLLLDLVVGEHHGDLDEGLLILSVVGVPPADVLVGGLLEVLLDVVEGVLGNVSDASVRVLPDVSDLGLDLSDEELDHGGLSGAVLADAGDAGGERHLDRDVVEGGDAVAAVLLPVDGVGEGALGDLHERLSLGLDSLDVTGLGELELELGGLEAEVGPGLRDDLDEVIKVALEHVELEVVDLEDVAAAVVEEARVVRHHDTGDVGEGVKVVLDPGDVDDVEVVSGLVKEEDVGALKHRTGERELHAPSAGEGGGGVLGLGLLVGAEADLSENLADLVGGAAHGLDLRVVQDVVDAREVGLLALDVGLDEDGADLGGVGEALDLAVGDGPHEGGLAGVVTAEEAVVLSALELHLGVVEKDLGTVGKGEGAVAELLGIIVIVVFFGDDEHLLGLNADLLDGSLGVEEGLKDGGDELGPLAVLHVADVHHGGSDNSGVRDGDAEGGGDLLGGQLVLEELLNGGGVAPGGDGLVTEALEPGELGNGALSDLTGLGVGDGGGVRGERGEEEGEEGRGVDRVVDELGHVVDNDSGLALGGGVLLLEATEKEGDGHGERRRLDGLDEGDSGELVHDLRDLLGLGDGGDDLAGHVLNVAVADDLAGGRHGLGGGGLDLLLGVPHASGDLGDDLGEGGAELLGGDGVELSDHVEGGLPGGPLLLHGEVGEDGGEETLHGHRGHVLGKGHGASRGGGTDIRLVVGGGDEDRREAAHEVGLGGGYSGEGLEGIEGSYGLLLLLLLAQLSELKNLVGEPTLDGSVGLDGGSEVSGLPDGELLHGSDESGHIC